MADYTIDPPAAGGQYTIDPPAAPPRKPPEHSLLRRATDATVNTLINPVVNFADYPVRAAAANIVGAVKGGLPVDEKSRLSFYKEKEKSLEGTKLPETGAGEAISTALGLPGTLIGKGVSAGAHAILPEGVPEAIGPYVNAAADVAPLGMIGRAGAPRGGAPKAAVQAAEAENRARALVSQRFNEGATVGGPSALDVMDEMQKGAKEGQPYVLADAENQELQDLLGTTYRQGGAGQGQIKQFLEGRRATQTPRVRDLLDRYVSSDSMKDTAEALLDARSQHARPLFSAAEEGPGTAALEHQFTTAFQEAGAAEAMAAQRVRQAEAAATQAAGRQSTAGNVYASSGANRGAAGASADLAAAKRDLAAATAEKEQARDVMRQAQADGTAATRGAMWSPYLQRLRGNQFVQQGINRGWIIEKNKADGTNTRFNPREYAVVGEDAAGNPVVGAVPNMRLWMTAKEGIDAAIADEVNKDTGRPTKLGVSLIELRNGLLGELDRINPSYKAARDAWSGDTSSFMALDKGRHLLDEKWFPTAEHVEEYLNGIPPGDHEFVKLGLAEQLRSRLGRAVDAADKSKIINNEMTRDRVRMLLGADADRFLEAMERERAMERTRVGAYGGSATQQRKAADDRNRRVMSALKGTLASMFHLNPVGTLGHALRLYSEWKGRPDMPMNEALARALTDPNLPLNTAGGGPLLPPLPVPKRYRMTPGNAFVGAEMARPHDDDPLRRALGGR